jgi:hypothetical protein
VVSARRRRRTVPHHLGTTAVLPLHRHNITAIQLPTTAATSSNRGETETKQRRRKNKKTEQNREVELKKKKQRRIRERRRREKRPERGGKNEKSREGE